MNHKQKGIIVRLSDEEFHALNEKVEMSGLPRQTYVRKLIHGVMPDGKISEECHTVFRTLDLIRNHIHLLILFGACENSNQLQKLKDYRSWITKVEFGLDKGFVWKWYKEDSQGDGLVPEDIAEILNEQKANQKERIKIPTEKLRKYFPKRYTAADMEKEIFAMLEKRYKEKQQGAR